MDPMDPMDAADATAGTTSVASPLQGQGGPHYALWHLVLYFLKLGTLGFGGPVALVGYMQRDLVERRGWMTPTEYAEGLALAQLLPGPLAGDLAIFLGFVHYRLRGATLACLAFFAPSFLMVVALGWIYVRYNGLPWIHAVFYGVGASVIGIIAASAYRLTRKTIGRDWLLWIVYLIMALTTIVTASESVALVLLAGIVIWLVKAPPWRWPSRSRSACFSDLPLAMLTSLTTAAGETIWATLWSLFSFFVVAGAFVFGSGLAIVPFLYGGVVHDHHWLTNQQFIDAVAVALITPGPVVITSGFIGFLVAGAAGATVATLGTILPSFLLTVALAPVLRRFGKRPGVAAFVCGVTAAAVGAITGAVVVLGRETLIDLPTVALALATAVLLLASRRVPEPVIVVAAALIGLWLYPLVHR
jgi:chromate transporter